MTRNKAKRQLLRISRYHDRHAKVAGHKPRQAYKAHDRAVWRLFEAEAYLNSWDPEWTG